MVPSPGVGALAALDAGASALTMVASKPKCAAAHSQRTARTGANPHLSQTRQWLLLHFPVHP
jgi:hypothetical protein